MHKSIEGLREILDYELKCAERYRRFITLVMVTAAGNDEDVEHVLSGSVRYCDILSEIEGSAMILMSETTMLGGQSAVDRYKSDMTSEGDLRFSIATFPSDGRGADVLMAVGMRRLKKAVSRERGSVVVDD